MAKSLWRRCQDGDTLQLELKGNLAAMQGTSTQAKRSPDTGDLMVQIKLVAGARNQLPENNPTADSC
jgi:hypothetical protein